MIRLAVSDRKYFTDAKGFHLETFRHWIAELNDQGVQGLYLREKDWDDAQYRKEIGFVFSLPKPPAFFVVPFRQGLMMPHSNLIFQTGSDLSQLKTIRALTADRFRLLYSAHSLSEAKAAAENGADFIFLSPIFATPSKPDAIALGPGILKQACEEISTPLIALGGIQKEHHATIQACGAFGLAAIRQFLPN